MESVLQVGSGQTVILGGLMQDNVQRNRQQLPGADRLDAAGEAVSFPRRARQQIRTRDFPAPDRGHQSVAGQR